MAQLARIRNGQLPSFNWAAFLVTMFWMSYRRMYLILLCLMILMLIEGTIEAILLDTLGADYGTERFLDLAVGLISGLLCGSFGDRVYIWDARRMIRAEVAKGPFHVPEILLARIASRGGTSVPAIFGVLGIFIGLMILADLIATADWAQ